MSQLHPSRINSIYEGTFWDNKYWYPPSLSWELVEQARNEGNNLAMPSDLLYIIPYTIAIVIGRYLYERLIGRPLAKFCLGNLARRRTPEECPELEKLYLAASSKSTPENPVVPSGWTPRRVEQWYRRRRNMDRPDLIKKFSETSYRFVVYCLLLFEGGDRVCYPKIGHMFQIFFVSDSKTSFLLWGYGMVTLWDKIWLWDNIQCWVDFPFQNLTWDIYFYYVIELAFYFSLCLSLLQDVKRKDFTEQIVHHFATIVLMVFSYMANFWRVGVLVIVIHDVSDIFLESAKLCLYCKKEKIADVLFTIFAVTFLFDEVEGGLEFQEFMIFWRNISKVNII